MKFKIDKINCYRNVRFSLETETFDVQPSITKMFDNIDKEGWIANIAMSFVDSAHWFRRNKTKKYLSNGDLHKIANNAAKCFMKNLTSD